MTWERLNIIIVIPWPLNLGSLFIFVRFYIRRLASSRKLLYPRYDMSGCVVAALFLSFGVVVFISLTQEREQCIMQYTSTYKDSENGKEPHKKLFM